MMQKFYVCHALVLQLLPLRVMLSIDIQMVLLYHEDRSLHQPGTGGLSLPDCLSQCSASQVRLTLLKKKLPWGNLVMS